jgi:hypothetical protein
VWAAPIRRKRTVFLLSSVAWASSLFLLDTIAPHPKEITQLPASTSPATLPLTTPTPTPNRNPRPTPRASSIATPLPTPSLITEGALISAEQAGFTIDRENRRVMIFIVLVNSGRNAVTARLHGVISSEQGIAPEEHEDSFMGFAPQAKNTFTVTISAHTDAEFSAILEGRLNLRISLRATYKQLPDSKREATFVYLARVDIKRNWIAVERSGWE